ncbi:MAG TPA: hypothetical protein VGL03_02340 [Thermoanaerobaculia bacterium]
MRARRLLVFLASASLLVLFLTREPPRDIGRRIDFLRRYASQRLEVRRLGGTSTDFNRRYFILLEWARRRLPAKTPGLAVFPDAEIPTRGQYLTVYHFAPLPTEVAPMKVPSGWLALIQGTRRPEGWRVVAELPYGALLEPAP